MAKDSSMPRLKRIVPGIYEGGEWRVWAGRGRPSNDPTWHVERAGAWHSSHPSLSDARAAIAKAAAA